MNTIDKIEAEFKLAQKKQDKRKLIVLRAIKAEVDKFEKESKSVADDTKVINLVKKAVKQREESAAIYKKAARIDLEATELYEIVVLEHFLPTMLSEEQMATIVDDCIRETGAFNIRQMGQVMGLCQKKAEGRADGKFLSTLIRAKLS